MAHIDEVPLVCKWPVQEQPSRQSWSLESLSSWKLNKGSIFFHKEATRTVFSLACLLFTSLNYSLCTLEKGHRWLHLLEWRKSRNQRHRLSVLWKTLLVLSFPALLSLLFESRSAPAVDIPVNEGQCRLCQWTLAAGKRGLFSTRCVSRAVWHTQLDPARLPATRRPLPFRKGPLMHSLPPAWEMWPVITFVWYLS